MLFFFLIDIECDTSELLPEGVIHNFPTPPSIPADSEEKNKQKNQPGSLVDLLLFPKMLAFAAMPQCWSTETGFLWKLSTVIHQMQVPFLACEKKMQVLQKCTMCLRK